jgi:predicted Rossmann fold flavoprotein
MKTQWDVIVIGGGAAGYFSAINIKINDPSLEVIILEQSKDVLNKVRISGGGRCNVTNSIWEPKELSKNYPRGEKALLGPLHKFACGDTMAWFEDRGVSLKIEEDGRVFPTSDDSESIASCLISEARKYKIGLQNNAKVKSISCNDNNYEVIANEQKYTSPNLVLATGCSPFFWDQLRQSGYTITKPVPSLFTFNIKDKRLDGLMGLSSNYVETKIKGTSLKSNGPILVTHWGMSGPAILKLSAWGARDLSDKNYHFSLTVDWLPSVSEDEIRTLKNNMGSKTILANALGGLPSRLWKGLLSQLTINEQTKWADINKDMTTNITSALKACTFSVNGKSTFKEEFVTAGGVALDQINFTNFESKIHKGLFMAGEVLDIDAITGGFNFQAAWTGGYLIGQHFSR